MAPINIGFVGLSSAGWAVAAHMPYLKQTDKYKIVALCNTSKAAAEKAIAHFGLPATTKAYGSPEDLAADPDVQLVVCSVRVDRHYDVCKAAVAAGKDCFSEWPLGKNIAEAKELAALAKAKGVRTMIGLQGQQDPYLSAIRDVVASGRIGRPLSSTMVRCAFYFGAQHPESFAYALDEAVGGNMVTIFGGHSLDSVLGTLGELKELSATMAITQPQVEILSDQGMATFEGKSGSMKPLRTITRTTADQMVVQGTLENGGVLTFSLRGGKPMQGRPGIDWLIHGDKGDIQATCQSYAPQLGLPGNEIKVQDFETGKVEVIDWEQRKNDACKDLQGPCADVGREYEAFASGGSYPDWQHALLRHRMIDAAFQSNELKKTMSYVH